MRAFLLLVLCFTTSTAAIAGLPLASELRGGAPIVSGSETDRVQILVDNDSFSLVIPENIADHDRWFTHGHTALFRRRLQLTSTSSTWAQGSLGQAIYTPNELRTARAAGLRGDRPFAGWLAASVGGEHARRDCLIDSVLCDGSADGFGYSHVGGQLLLGTTGTWSLAGVVQRSSHWLSRSLQPRGWDDVVEPAGIAIDTVVFGEGDLIALHGANVIAGSRPALHLRLGTTIEAGSRRTSLAGNTTVQAGLMGDPMHNALPTPGVDLPVAVYLQWRSSLKALAYDTSIEARVHPDVAPSVAAPVVFDTAASIVVRVGPIEGSFGQGYISNQMASLPRARQTGQFTAQCSLSLLW
jgi:hypothetical protein